MPLFLICGYRHSGKDTLYQCFSGESNYSWKVYGSQNSEPLTQILGNHNLIRIGFADILKREVLSDLDQLSNQLETPILPPDFSIEKSKDIPLKSLTDYPIISNEKYEKLNGQWEKIQNGGTFRDFCIQKGIKKREIDPDHWCKLVSPIYLSSIENHLDNNIIITDFRFPNEYLYFKSLSERFISDKMSNKVITIRVFRKEVPIPDQESERELNLFPTDYLVIPQENHQEQFNIATEKFSFYSNFIPIETIN